MKLAYIREESLLGVIGQPDKEGLGRDSRDCVEGNADALAVALENRAGELGDA
jgi:hypothetical protein